MIRGSGRLGAAGRFRRVQRGLVGRGRGVRGFGGGGRGLKVVFDEADIEEGFASAGREAKEAFGRGECYVEKFLTHPRHVEAQVLADTHGNVRVLGTRDCSTQRRFQKLIEEAPAPALSDAQRNGIIEGARSICSKVGYTGAGTVEYIVSEDGTISFLEVNTRVQVEHPVTEVVTGTDIIAEQFRIAAGEPLSFDEDPQSHGHAFEFRINAEDILNGFAPCPGTIVSFEPPTGPGIRVDSAVRSGSIIPPYYDSLIAKLVVWGPTREIALARARFALREFTVTGVRTVLPFHRDMMDEPALIGTAAPADDAAAAGASEIGVFTDWVDHNYRPSAANQVEKVEAIYTQRRNVAVEIDGKLVASAMAGYEGHRGWVNYLAVCPQRHQQGLARQLMAYIEEQLLAMGCPKLSLQVRDTNAAALAFYERLGYKIDASVSLGKRLIADD